MEKNAISNIPKNNNNSRNNNNKIKRKYIISVEFGQIAIDLFRMKPGFGKSPCSFRKPVVPKTLIHARAISCVCEYLLSIMFMILAHSSSVHHLVVGWGWGGGEFPLEATGPSFYMFMIQGSTLGSNKMWSLYTGGLCIQIQ